MKDDIDMNKYMKSDNPEKPQNTPKPVKKSSLKSREDYEQELGELTATLQHVQADFENYKKRVAAERAGLMDTAKAAVLAQLLPALDNFDRAAGHLPKELADNSWAQGMSYVGTQLEQLLDEIGVQKFSPMGEIFNHNEHEAVEFIQSAKPEGTILEVVTPGYRIGEQIARPAVVKVSSGATNKENSSNHNESKEGEKL